MARQESAHSDAEIAERLRALPGWTYTGGFIRRVYDTDGWPTTLMLVNALGFLAEAADHHPDLEVSWGRVVVKLQSHSAGGITDKDLALAGELERLALWRADAPLAGTGRKWVRAAEPS